MKSHIRAIKNTWRKVRKLYNSLLIYPAFLKGEVPTFLKKVKLYSNSEALSMYYSYELVIAWWIELGFFFLKKSYLEGSVRGQLTS